MAKRSVTIRNDALEKIKGAFMKKRNLDELGKVAVSESKLCLERGISPVRGNRNFERYSQSYQNAIRKGWLEKSKKVRPVNLYLSGDMLREFKHRIRSDRRLEIGIWDPKMAKRAIYHNNGTKHIPRRRFIPVDRDEKLAVTIDRALFNAIQDIINRETK